MWQQQLGGVGAATGVCGSSNWGVWEQQLGVVAAAARGYDSSQKGCGFISRTLFLLRQLRPSLLDRKLNNLLYQSPNPTFSVWSQRQGFGSPREPVVFNPSFDDVIFFPTSLRRVDCIPFLIFDPFFFRLNNLNPSFSDIPPVDPFFFRLNNLDPSFSDIPPVAPVDWRLRALFNDLPFQ